MGNFGERLQREREMRGITLDEISEATKIGTRSLKALEEEDFKKLPGGIFNRGFVRSYARYLGIDEDEAVADYESAASELPLKGQDILPSRSRGGASERAQKAPSAAESDTEEGSTHAARRPSQAYKLLTAFCLLAIVVYLSWSRNEKQRAATPEPERVMASTGSTPGKTASDSTTAQPAAGTGSAGAPAAAVDVPLKTDAPSKMDAPLKGSSASIPPPVQPAHSQEFELRVHAREDSWVSITADGKERYSGTLTASSEQVVRARNQVTLTVGNAGGVEIFHNGQAIPSLGELNKARTVTFNSKGLQ